MLVTGIHRAAWASTRRELDTGDKPRYDSAMNAQLFVYGFAKSRRDNIGETDLAQLKDLAALLLGYDDKELRAAVSAGELLEVTC